MKILLVDDHGVVRQGYSSLLTAMFAEVTLIEAASGTDAALLFHQERPDLMILDINLPDISGIEVTCRIREVHPEARILMFSMYEEPVMVRQALDAGALGYISKTSAPEAMVAAVQAVSRGEPFLEPKLAQLLQRGPNQGAGPHKLAPREQEIYELLIQGVGNQQIAARLGISPKTVANRTTVIKQKLGVRTHAELVRLALTSR